MFSVVVILPVHNESWLIGSVLGQVTEYAHAHPQWRFIFVDDGSTDDTPRKISDHIESGSLRNMELQALNPNRGKARALKQAILDSTEEFVLFTDGDLAYRLEHLDQLAAGLEHADIVIGSRQLAEERQTNITFLRRMTGSIFNLVVRLLTGLPHKDTQAGLKGFQRNAARAIFRAQVVTDFAFDAELLFLARKLGLVVHEIPARVSSRHSYKKSKVSLLKDPLRMFASLLRMRVLHRKLKRRPHRGIPGYSGNRPSHADDSGTAATSETIHPKPNE
ncbi:MAG: glycosyl transferase [Phycisphaerae bacterium]|nr:glycosyl transferase [Phycisphaerae bacterium]HAW94931.1 glycosyl transferase [Phycisphaerales bacterium]